MCWIMSTRSKHLRINFHVWRYLYGRRRIQFKQHFVITLRYLTQKKMILVDFNIFVYLAMLTPNIIFHVFNIFI